MKISPDRFDWLWVILARHALRVRLVLLLVWVGLIYLQIRTLETLFWNYDPRDDPGDMNKYIHPLFRPSQSISDLQ